MERPARWHTLASEYLCKDSYLRVRKDTRTAPGFGNHDFYILEYPDWVNVVALTEEEQIVLVRQFRHGLGTVTLETPGGIVDPGEEPCQTAVRELAEETGYAPAQLSLLAKVSVNPAIQNNYCHLYFARGCRRVRDQALDGTESIAVELVHWKELPQLLARGTIDHSLNCLALQLAFAQSSA